MSGLPRKFLQELKKVADKIELRFALLPQKLELRNALDDIGILDLETYLVTIITLMDIKNSTRIPRPDRLEDGIYALINRFQYKSNPSDQQYADTRETLDKVIRLFVKFASPKRPMTQKEFDKIKDVYEKTISGISFNEKIPDTLKMQMLNEFRLEDYIPADKLPKQLIEEKEIKYSKFQYWNFPQEKLTLLYGLLFEYKLIKCKKNLFLSVFAKGNVDGKIFWYGNLTDLFYLLYMSYGKENEYEGLDIYGIVNDLFDYKDNKGREATRSSYNQFKHKVQSTSYPQGFKRYRRKFKDTNKILENVFDYDIKYIILP